MELYDAPMFSARGVTLYFLQSGEIVYPQFGGEFVPDLSIIDVMMHNDNADVRSMLQRFRLVHGSEP